MTAMKLGGFVMTEAAGISARRQYTLAMGSNLPERGIAADGTLGGEFARLAEFLGAGLSTCVPRPRELFSVLSV